MMTDIRQRRQNWAHSILNDPGSTDKQRRDARAILAKLAPEELSDHDDCLIRTGGMFDD
jgi:hypothetical protein